MSLDYALFSERTLAVTFNNNENIFKVLNFHSLTGVGYRKAKSAQFAIIADYLYNNREKPLIVCCDANEPKIDHLDLENVEFFNQRKDKGKYANYIFGIKAEHGLKDAYRIWLSKNKYKYEKVRENQESSDNIQNTPLAVSHVVRGGGKRRYDYILISKHWEIKNIEYRLEQGIKNGSDHAIVIADLNLKL